MRNWKSIALAFAVATTLSAYADDRTSTSSGSTQNPAADTRSGSSTNAAMPDRTDSTASDTSSSSRSRASETPSSSSSSSSATMSDHTHMSGTSAAMRNDPELQNLTTEKFFNKAAAAGMKEVQAAELALKSSKNEQVKSFARQMISDHTKQNSQLTTLAAQKNVQVPKDLPAKDKADVEKLRAASGTTFDTAFSQQMKTDHEKAVALFQSCANATQVAKDVRKFCSDNLSTLEEHHQAASNLDSRSSSSRAASTDE